MIQNGLWAICAEISQHGWDWERNLNSSKRGRKRRVSKCWKVWFLRSGWIYYGVPFKWARRWAGQSPPLHCSGTSVESRSVIRGFAFAGVTNSGYIIMKKRINERIGKATAWIACVGRRMSKQLIGSITAQNPTWCPFSFTNIKCSMKSNWTYPPYRNNFLVQSIDRWYTRGFSTHSVSMRSRSSHDVSLFETQDCPWHSSGVTCISTILLIQAQE